MTDADMRRHLRGLAVGFAGTRHTHLTEALTLALEKLTAPPKKGFDYGAFYERRNAKREASGKCKACGRLRVDGVCEKHGKLRTTKEGSHVEDSPRNVSLS